ncbi:Multidrug/Oligosaccharidyl-lipid/Polysaccharide (MOP) Flippase Superfamily [Phytophthora cinnamomi]|uniref:Multidrug/Oligosaccharidyl-lipid/Polysaccharide (MOP) Flippase Superfamily n=1 Tax=Phytophthora cinnamomi TaxID=4785 RepID=UPI00355A517A|nr:Multidrug/Oligosaccharidyl-lipid/Polysaccharide (MOP) Flippase Superfamily [Phytophthora cinnamomi]
MLGQAWGARNGELAGTWLQIGLAVVLLLSLPVVFWYWSVGCLLALSKDDAEVSSQGDGFCRSHGGGRRCGHPSGCSKWAQRNGMCMAHSEGKYGNSYRGRQHRMEQQEPVVQQT